MERTDIQIAKEHLGKNNNVLVIVKNGKVLFKSTKNGIQPFFDALNKLPRKSYFGCSVADHVVGKAALMLAAYIGAKEIFTPLASQHAVDASLNLELELNTGQIVPYIINRTHDGMCPMEKAVLNIDEPENAYHVLKIKLQN